jgi:5'-3' exonuclease
MGVPGFFSWLLRQYKTNNILLDNTKTKVKKFYIDANCLIHPQCFKILGLCDDENIAKLEEKMTKRIFCYINYLVGYVNPEEVFISIDGVAPLAKINQQRKRRYRSIDDNKIKDAIRLKHGKKIGSSWSNIVITPGTEFMEKLHLQMLKYMKQQAKENKIKYTYSSYHTAGEGEHKILTDIKKYRETDYPFVIYGLDADLFFLAMASRKREMYLLRETNQIKGGVHVEHEIYDVITDVAEDLTFVSIDNTKKCYNEQLRKLIQKRIFDENLKIKLSKSVETDNCFNNDFIFICYLLGNDFLPHFPSIDIKKEGLDMVLDCYITTYLELNYHLIKIVDDKVQVDNIFLIRMMQLLGDIEEQYFYEILPEYIHSMHKRKCNVNDNYEIELWNLENMRGIKIDDPVKLGVGSKDEFMFRYYNHYFGTSHYQQEFIDTISAKYLEGLMWVSKYYFEECPSWKWQYPFTHAPFISDIAKYYIKNNIDINKIIFPKDTPLTPCVQLLSVLPPSCSNIIPYSYRNLTTNISSPVIDMFPEKVVLDMINKDLYWQCIPLIPVLEINRILEAVKGIKLTTDEKIRDKELDDFIFLP